MNEDSVTEPMSGGSVVSNPPQHQLDEALRMRIRAQVDRRALVVKRGGKIRVRSAEQ